MRVLAHNVALSEFVRLTILNIPIWLIVSAQMYIIYIYTDHKGSHKITIYPYETACKSRTSDKAMARLVSDWGSISLCEAVQEF